MLIIIIITVRNADDVRRIHFDLIKDKWRCFKMMKRQLRIAVFLLAVIIVVCQLGAFSAGALTVRDDVGTESSDVYLLSAKEELENDDPSVPLIILLVIAATILVFVVAVVIMIIMLIVAKTIVALIKDRDDEEEEAKTKKAKAEKRSEAEPEKVKAKNNTDKATEEDNAQENGVSANRG